MDPRITGSIQSLKPITRKGSAQAKPSPHVSFGNLFQTELQRGQSLKLSKHAEQRLLSRGISISKPLWNRIEEKVLEAEQKGVRDPLILTEEAALVVSAKNKTVITVLALDEAEDHIFTNIDGTIVMNNTSLQ